MNAIGGSMKWYRDAIFGGETPEKDAYDRISRLVSAETDRPSGIIFLPYMSGERSPIWDVNARGTMIGLNMKTSRADLARAIMEGACYALRDNLDQVRNAGISYDHIICCGGCSKSEIWLKIKASVMQKNILVPEVNLGAPGGLSYINAAYMGEYASPEEASEACMRIRQVIEPVPAWVRPYDELYEIYLDSYRALKERFEALSRVELHG